MPMTRRRKLVIALVVAPVLLVLLLVAVALTPAVQTFVARKALADQGTVGRVAVGTGSAEITSLKLEQPGLKVSVPSFKADMPLLGAAGGTIDVRSIVARDIVIDFDPKAAAAAPAASVEPSVEPAQPAGPFAGVLKAVPLPAGLKVNGLDIAGVVNVAGDEPLALAFAVTGGGVEAGKAGRVEVKLSARVPLEFLPPSVTERVAEVSSTFALVPTLDAAGQLSDLALQFDTLLKGGFFSKDTLVRTEARAARSGSAGETWTLRLVAADKTLVSADAQWAPGARDLPGKWKIDVTQADLKPFIPLPILPKIAISGSGDVLLSGTGAAKLDGGFTFSADDLDALGLPALGAVDGAARFDIGASAAELKVNVFKLDASSGGTPVLLVEAVRPFACDPATGKVSGSLSGDLAAIKLLGVPAAWIQLFVPGLELGGPVTGEWGLRPDGDGILLDTRAPLALTGVRYSSDGALLASLDEVKIAGLRARQSPAGLEAGVEKLSVVAGGKTLVTAELAATQKTGAPLQAKLVARAQLADIANQPVLRGQTRLSAGQALFTLDVTKDAAIKAGGRLAVTGLRADGKNLPEITLDLDVARDSAGVVTARLPLVVAGAAAKRASDLELSATATPVGEAWNVAAKLASQALSLPDLQLLAAISSPTVPAKSTKSADPAPSSGDTPVAPASAGPAEPLWGKFTGDLEIALARIVLVPGVETDAKGRIALTKDALNLEKLQSVLSTGGSLDLSGALNWRAEKKDYAVAGSVAGRDVTVGPLLRAMNPGAAVPLEGTYALTATLAGEGAEPGAAASAAAADFTLTGKSGVLRVLNLDTNRYAKIGGSKELGALAGLIGAAAGDSSAGRIAQQAAAANGFARKLGNLPYDEIVFDVKRGADGAITVEQVSLRSPEISLVGTGSVGALPGRAFLDQPLALTLDLGASGEIARQLAALNLLKNADESAGYLPLVEPVKLDGTLRQVGTTQLNRLVLGRLGL